MANSGFGNERAASIAFSSPPSSSFKVHLSSPSRKTISVKKPKVNTSSFKTTLPKVSAKSGLGSSSTSVFGSSTLANPYGGLKEQKAGSLSPQQAFALGYQKGHASSSGSFFDAAKHLGGSLVSDVANVISRPNWGMARGYDLATKHGGFSVENFAKGFKQGAIDGKAENFGQILRRRNPHANGLATTLAGLGLDIATDPTTYIGGAGIFKEGSKLFDVSKVGAHAGLTQFEKQGAAKLMGREVAPLAKDATQSEKAAHTAATAFNDRLATQEFKNARSKYLALQFGPTKRFSVSVTTPFRLSKAKDLRLADQAAGKGIPGLSSLRHAVGNHFVPGYSDPIGHLIENHVGHVAERNGDVMMQQVYHILHPAVKELPSKSDMMKALVAASHEGTTKHGAIVHDVLDKALQEAGFKGAHLEAAHNFVGAYHKAGQFLKAMDRQFGNLGYHDVTQGEAGKVYVPHVFEKRGQVANIARAKSVVGHQGFEQAKKLTLEQAMNLPKEARMKLITDPVELMARRIQKGAIGQAAGHMRNTIMRNWAVPDKVLGDTAHVKQALSKVSRLHGVMADTQAKLDKLGTLRNAQRRLKYKHGKELASLTGDLSKLSKKDLRTREGQLAELQAEHNLLSHQRDVMKALAHVQNRKHTPGESIALAQIGKKLKALEKQMGGRETIDSMKQRHAQELEALGVQHAKQAHELQLKLDRTAKEIAQAEPAAIRKAFVKNPALKAGLVPLDALKGTHSMDAMKADVHNAVGYEAKLNEAAALKETSKGMTVNYHVPQEIHDAVTRVDAVLHDPQQMQGLVKAFHKVLSKWKLYVTMANPGYGIRNSMSDMWNAYVTGMPVWAMGKYAEKAARLMRAAHNGDTKALQQLDEAAYHGILTGFYNTDIRAALKGGSKAHRLNVVRAMTSANIARENLGRMAHYLYRRDFEKMAPEQAASIVRVAHFDYTDLTPFEQKTMKGIAPFYTWTRKNVPLQVQQILARPGRMATFVKAANESEQGTGIKPGELAQTVYSSHPLAFKTPLGYFDPNIGWSDLARVSDPRQLAQMLNPALQLPIEVGDNINLFTGQALSGPNAPHQLTPAPGIVADLLAPLGQSGTTGRTVNGGKEMHSPGISNIAALALGQVPLGSEILGRNKITQKEQGTVANLGGVTITPKDLSYFGGLSLTRPNQKEEQFLATFNAENAQKSALKAARESGQFPAAKKSKKSAYEKMMEALIRKQMARK